MSEIEDDNLSLALENFARRAYRRGLERGLMSAEKIADWLTWKPQSDRMEQIEAWARAEIKKAMEAT